MKRSTLERLMRLESQLNGMAVRANTNVCTMGMDWRDGYIAASMIAHREVGEIIQTESKRVARKAKPSAARS